MLTITAESCTARVHFLETRPQPTPAKFSTRSDLSPTCDNIKIKSAPAWTQ